MFSKKDADQCRKGASLSHEGYDTFESPNQHLTASMHGEAPLKASHTGTVIMGTTKYPKTEGINESS